MSVTPSPIGGFAAQFFDNNGVILSGGKIYTYAAGTTTPQASYTSAAGVTPHANPIILDSAGRVPGGEIWLTDGLVYKFVIETAKHPDWHLRQHYGRQLKLYQLHGAGRSHHGHRRPDCV
jgi:hypothetical protein